VAQSEPVYKHIEFCRNAETLWRKIESKWDWLGVHRNGQFVVGYPKLRGRQLGSLSTEVTRPGADPGAHGVRLYVPLGSHPSREWFATPEEARARFEEIVHHQRDEREGPHLVRLELVESGRVSHEEFVVVNPPTYR
jgi:hypothetical protein